MKNKKLKLVALAGVTVLTAVMLTGCGNNDVKTYDKEQVNVNIAEMTEENNVTENNDINATMTTDEIKELYLEKLKADDNQNSEKLLEYRVDDVSLMDKSQIMLDGIYYKDTDILAIVTYSVKPQDINNSIWIAGNGVIEGDWVVEKVACVCIRDGEIISDGTGW